ncbi:sensor histidine kinase [Curtobacterium luteum]|uniref:histidine kinase n=1 Tax=Curtobacterium luteum TaxID=33881 RepID=A0A175S4B7_9MICO|nr:HAMP domain-containing sensor histidine kinase [Curtobacterium luteum]KTR11750.1 hypothetical protein NS184_00835 [Curtobacterium luteum]
MSRAWSIGARTALVFAVASMALTAAVLVFVNLASQASFAGALQGPGPSAPASGRATAAPGSDLAVTAVPTAGVTGGSNGAPGPTSIAIVQTVSTLQWQWSAVGIVVAGLLAGVVGWVVSRRMLRPVDTITQTATRLSASNLHERIGLAGPDDELRRLATTIDALLARLEAAFEGQRRFAAQASHELRTPLAVQRAALQIGLPDDASPEDIAVVREQLLTENRRTERLIASLLLLAEAERDISGHTEDVDPEVVVTETCAALATAAREAGVRLEASNRPGGQPIRWQAEPALVRQLLHNLVDNAVEYNEADGFVRITTDPSGWTVENSGQVVTADRAAILVEPFRRGASTNGHRHSGLGLSIVVAVVRAHGWSLDVRPRPGGGLVVRVDARPA